MTIDEVLIRPVNHYLMGMAGAANSIHSEISVRGNLAEVKPDIEAARAAFLENCANMLADPSKYAKIADYQLKPGDNEFLQSLMEKAKQADWLKPAEVQELSDYIAAYCPGNPIRKGFLSQQ